MPVKTHPPNPHRGLERFPLLTDTDPGTDRCINVWIPDSPEYLELFGTAMRWLMNGFKYERDLTHKGEAQARAFTRAYAAHLLSDCGGSGVSITFRQTNCLLEYSTDDGATWQTAYVGADCLDWGISTGRILGGSAIDDAIASGKISGGAQQGPTSAPTPGLCKDFYVTLSANQKWICPVPITGDFNIQVEQCKGGWTPDPTHYWYCPSGETYTLGGCAPGTGATDAGDPLNTVNHMRLVGNYGSTWFDAYNTTYVVPSSVGTQETLFLQANDSDISNNLGSITFHVSICNGQWVHYFDFRTGQHGFTGIDMPDGPGMGATYSPGVGFITRVQSNNWWSTDQLKSAAIAPTTITGAGMHYYLGSVDPEGVGIWVNNFATNLGMGEHGGNAWHDMAAYGSWTGVVGVNLSIARSFPDFITGCIIETAWVSGRGSDPF